MSVGSLLWLLLLARAAASEESAADGNRPVFVRSPADLAQVGTVIPRGNLNPSGGHVRPVKHAYVEYPIPRNGGRGAVALNAMAPGDIVAVYQRQAEACLQPIGADRTQCASAPGAKQMVDEYGIWIQHTGEVTSSYDHLHELNPRFGLPDWRDNSAGWISIGPLRFLALGVNGAIAPVRVRPGEHLGFTRDYFSAWDLGIIDTRKTAAFLGSGPLRYPTNAQLFAAYVAAGGAGFLLPPNKPYPGEQFVNSACFIDLMSPRLEADWRAKLAGDKSCGRPDWDASGTVQGNWHRAEVTAPTFANMTSTEDNSVSFSPYNLDPVNRVQIGIGRNFFAVLPPTGDATELRIRSALEQGLLFTPETGTRRNSKPTAVGVGDYACYDIPDATGSHSLLVYHPLVGGSEHVKLRYSSPTCASTLASLAATPSLLDTQPYFGDYVR